jgi:hypothetical protein
MAYSRSDRRGFDKLLYEQHVERIRSVKGTVDNKPPRPHPLSNKNEIDKVTQLCHLQCVFDTN